MVGDLVDDLVDSAVAVKAGCLVEHLAAKWVVSKDGKSAAS